MKKLSGPIYNINLMFSHPLKSYMCKNLFSKITAIALVYNFQKSLVP